MKVGTIVDIRRLRDEGLKKVAVARRLDCDRGTVSKYWEGSAEAVTAPRYKQRASKVEPYRDYIMSRLEKYPELTAQRLFLEIRKQGYDGSERSVRRFVAAIRPKSFRQYKPVEVLVGEQAQADWGHFGTLVEDGRRLKLYAFVITLSWSRAMYAEFITSLNMATFAGCLHRAFAFFGGVPASVLFDNAKTVVASRVGHVVQFNPDLLQLALRYNFTPKACWVNDPQSKGRVESSVKYLRSGFFYGREYESLDDLNRQLWEWLDEVAHHRTHGSTGEVPGKQLEVERAYLRPFDPGAGPSGVLEHRTAGKDSLIAVDGNFYSVPSHLARRRIHIRRFENRIEVLDGKTVVAEHPLASGKGQRIVQDGHYPKAPRRRRAHPLQTEFEALCPQAADYLKGLSRCGAGPLKEQMERIVALKASYTEEAMAAAMSRALAYGSFGYRALKRILELQAKAPASLPQTGAHDRRRSGAGALQRDPSYYAGVGV